MNPLLEFTQWLQATQIPTALRMSTYVYPVILTLHLTAIAFFGAMIFLTDLRLLGMTLRKIPVPKVIQSLRNAKRIGFLIVATCGVLLASSKAEEYYYNWFFWTKMSLLALIAVHGLVFRGSVYRNTTAPLPARARLAAVSSMLLWCGVMIAGRGIGYIEPPLEKLHALLTR